MAEKVVLQDGKTKRIYETNKADQVILEFKDAESEFDGELKAKFKNKSVLKNNISEAIYEYLQGYNIPTHYKKRISEREMQVSKLEMIPIIVLVRNVAAGSLSKRFKVPKGNLLKYPVIEYYLKVNKLNNPMILESHAYAFEYATPDEMKHISRLALKVNAVMKAFFERRKLKLVDYQLEFGRTSKQILLGDEITPDTCRIWNIEDDDSLTQNHFSFENGRAQAAYKEIYERLIENKGH